MLLDNTSNESRQVLKETTAWLLTSAMQDVVNSGTGGRAKFSGMSIAGKTGTTENSTDLWLSAFTPYYTGSVWTGYDENKHMENIYDQSWHMRIWKNIMERIHEGLPDKDFEIPSSVVQKTICTQTGKLAVSGCSTLTEVFRFGQMFRPESCAGHKTTTTTDKDDKDDDKDTENNTSEHRKQRKYRGQQYRRQLRRQYRELRR